MYLVEICVSTGDNWAHLLSRVHEKNICPELTKIQRFSSKSLALRKIAKYELNHFRIKSPTQTTAITKQQQKIQAKWGEGKQKLHWREY